MRLADWDAATTARYRQLWERANRAHEEGLPVEPVFEGGSPFIRKGRRSEKPPEERRRWRILYALASLLSTHPPILPPERLLRDAVMKHCEEIGQPLPQPRWRVLQRTRRTLVFPPPPADGLRATWERVEASAARIEAAQGPIARLTPFLDRLRAGPEPSDDLLLGLWAMAVELIQKEPANPVPVRLLRYFDGEQNRAESYRQFELPKRRGGTRTITTPQKSLKWLQRSLLQVLTHLFPRHKCGVGFERGESVVTHAKAHAGKRWVYVVDIQDFFPSITRSRVYGMLRAKPFEASEPIARYLANLVTHDGALPQGAPTSPILANLLCRRMDARLFKWARERGHTYTRYADDLAFSTNRAGFPEADRQRIVEIVEGEGFRVHPEKQRLMPWYGRQLVTGLVVNRKANVPREYVRGLRALLFNVETFGWASQVGRTPLYEKGEEWLLYKRRALSVAEFERKVERQREQQLLVRPGSAIRKAGDVSTLQRVVRGRIEFVGAVRGKDAPIYRRLLEQYHRLVGRERAFSAEARKGKRAFVPEPLPELPEATSNYVEVMNLLRAMGRQEKTEPDLYAWVERKAAWSLEAEWLLKDFGALDASERKGKVRELAHSLDTHPHKTAAFFRQFGVGKPFRRLLHEPLGEADEEGRFEFEQGERQSAGEIVGACKAALARNPLPNRLKTETCKVLRECWPWLEVHPREHPYVSGPLQQRLQTYKWEVRFDDEPDLDLWDRLAEVVEMLRGKGGVIELGGLPHVFYTYTPAVLNGLRLILRSLVEKAVKKAVGGVVQPVRIETAYEHVGQTEQAVVVLQAHDGPVGVEPALRNVLRGDTQAALYHLRGFARWTMEMPFADGHVRAYDVTQNAEVDPVQTDLPGFRHVLTFYQ